MSGTTASRLACVLAIATIIHVHPALPAELPPEYVPIVDNKLHIARSLTRPIARCFRRRDTSHPVFHGCIDWHSAVHAAWALTAYTRATGDRRYVDLIRETLRPDLIEVERKALQGNKDFEMPYGRAWFLRLAIDYGRTFQSDLLTPFADQVAESLMSYYARHPPIPFSRSYDNAAWALLNVLDYALERRNAPMAIAVDRLTRSHFLRHRKACPIDDEGSTFMAVCLNWAWLVSRILPRDEFLRWLPGFLPSVEGFRPVKFPRSAHEYGMNFSRAWGLWELHSVTKDRKYLELFAAHFAQAYDNPENWDGDYLKVGHWVSQFGLFALLPVFGPGYR